LIKEIQKARTKPKKKRKKEKGKRNQHYYNMKQHASETFIKNSGKTMRKLHVWTNFFFHDVCGHYSSAFLA
jgi:hypothetical protein